MAGITVATSNAYVLQTYRGVPIRKAKLAIAGLTAGAANVIPHGLPSAPLTASYEPGAGGGWGETSPPDATNLYITVAAGGATAGTVYAEY
jgi:hypothetical protein